MRRCAYIAIVLAGILTCVGALYATPHFGNYLWVGSGDSMLPARPSGTPNLVHRCGVEDINVGDVVTFRSEPEQIYVSHRVVEKGQGFLITRGDANPVNDPAPVTNENLVGKEIWSGRYFAPIFRLCLVDGRVDRTLRLVCIEISGLLTYLALSLALFLLLAAIYKMLQILLPLRNFKEDTMLCYPVPIRERRKHV